MPSAKELLRKLGCSASSPPGCYEDRFDGDLNAIGPWPTEHCCYAAVPGERRTFNRRFAAATFLNGRPLPVIETPEYLIHPIPCIERCAFGAVKAWTAWSIASNEIETRHYVDFDQVVGAMAMTAKDMNSKYKETSEGGLAVSVTLC